MKKRLLTIVLFLMLAVAWQVPVFAQYENYSAQPVPTFKTVIINGQLRFIAVRGSYVYDPFSVFLTAQQATGLYKPIGYTLTNAEVLAAIGYNPYNAVINPSGFISANYLGFDNRYLQLNALNGYATQNYVNNQGFLTNAPVPSVFNRVGAISANQADYQVYYPLLSGAYNDPTWINSLAGTKITGLGSAAFLNASIGSSSNALVQRNPGGEIYFSYAHTTAGVETGADPSYLFGTYDDELRKFSLISVSRALQLGEMAKQDTSKFIKREYLQDMASFKRTGQFYASSTDPANPLSGAGSTGLGVSVLSMFEGPNNGSYFISADGYNTITHRYYDAYGSLYANGAWHTSHFLLDNNFRDYVYSKGYIDTAFNNIALPVGTAAQYIDGTKKLQTLNTSVVPEGSNQYFTTARARTSFTGAGGITINQLTGVITGASGGTNGFNFDVSTDTGAQLTANNTITFPHHLTGYSAGSVIVGNCYDLGTPWALNYRNCKMDGTNIIICFASAVDLASVMSFGFQITK